jgi:hypothetical protein
LSCVMWFTPIIQRWRSEQDKYGIFGLAADLGLPTKNVREWKNRDSIPADWYAAVARAAVARGFSEITVEHLAGIAEARRLAREQTALSTGAAA